MAEDPEKRKARHARYNGSAKGHARDLKYEEAHPERKSRWSVGMIAFGRRMAADLERPDGI